MTTTTTTSMRMDVEAASLKAMMDARSCAPCGVPRLAAPPSAVEFATEYLAKNVPFVCARATEGWRAHAAWSSAEDVAARLCASGSSVARVNVAPYGRGDAAVYYTGERIVGMSDDVDVVFDGEDDDGKGKWLFVEPSAEDVDAVQFIRSLAANTDGDEERFPANSRAYASMQNDNLRTDPALRAMYEDVGDVPAFVAEAFAGVNFDAVNIWIGNDGSQTAYHKDYYENFYTVVTGTKIFTLRPPCDYAMMRYTPCVPGKFEIVDAAPTKRWRVRCASRAEPRVSWSIVDVDRRTKHPVYEGGEDSMQYAAFAGTSPPPALEVEVRAGETLYLPSMWFHRVRQRGFTVAVNHWYDMHFGDRFASANFMKDVCESCAMNSGDG